MSRFPVEKIKLWQIPLFSHTGKFFVLRVPRGLTFPRISTWMTLVSSSGQTVKDYDDYPPSIRVPRKKVRFTNWGTKQTISSNVLPKIRVSYNIFTRQTWWVHQTVRFESPSSTRDTNFHDHHHCGVTSLTTTEGRSPEQIGNPVE